MQLLPIAITFPLQGLSRWCTQLASNVAELLGKAGQEGPQMMATWEEDSLETCGKGLLLFLSATTLHSATHWILPVVKSTLFILL